MSPNTASRSRALNRCAQSSRSTAFENTHPAVCSADLASSRNTASISTPQTSQTLPLEVPARVPHKKDDQDSTQPHRVESIKSLGDFSFSSSSTCDAILHRHRMSLQRNIAAEYDFFNGLLGFGRRPAREASTWRRARHRLCEHRCRSWRRRSGCSHAGAHGVRAPGNVRASWRACARYIAATGTPATSPALSSACAFYLFIRAH